jgi:UDP-glucose 4-epimerase
VKILVTGATGFVGSHLIAELGSRHEIYGIIRSDASEESDDGVSWIRQDLAHGVDSSKFPPEIDAVVHLAQSKRYREFPDGAADMFAINVRATFDLLEYARAAGAQSFLFTSSGAVYGHDYEKFVETDPVSPLNFYLSSKYSAELLIANYQRFFNTIVFRLFFIYGPGQRGMLIPSLADRVERGEIIVIEGNPGLAINPIYIADAVRVFEPALALSRSGLFNVAGDEVVNLTELVHLVGRLLGKRPHIEYAEGGAAGDLVGDIDQMRQVLGIVPRTPLVKGLGQLIAKRAHSAVPGE